MKPTLRQACSWPRPRAQFAFKDSMIHIICNSHYVSHFAAFFIDTGAKISVVESCLWFVAVAGELTDDWLQAQWLVAVGGFVQPRWSEAAPPLSLRREGEAAPVGPPDLGRRPARSFRRTGVPARGTGAGRVSTRGPADRGSTAGSPEWCSIDSMILPQVHLRKPCYDFSFL